MELQQNAASMGLMFVEELAFENGAVYRGYLKNDERFGPGI